MSPDLKIITAKQLTDKDTLPITIRRGDIDDLTELQQLFVDTVTTVCKRDYNDRQIKVWASGIKNRKRWSGILTSQLVLVARARDRIVGFCSLDNGNHIDLFYVHKDFQGQGIATRLYAAIAKEAIKLGQNRLTSDVSISAKPFFLKEGFEVLAKQTVVRQGIELTNFKMAADLPVIKPYNDSYRKQLLAVWEKSVLATHDFLDPADFKQIRKIVRTIDYNAFSVFCLMHRHMVAGFIGVAGIRVEMLFLDPGYIGRGFGKMLMDFAITKLNADEVDVNEQNINAVAFYRDLGFETFERSEKDSQGNDYPILKMKLKKPDQMKLVND